MNPKDQPFQPGVDQGVNPAGTPNQNAFRNRSPGSSGDFNQPLADGSLVACPDCDLLQRVPEIAVGTPVRCPRCNTELWRRCEDSINRTLALALAAAVLYVIANTVPMLGLTAVGHQSFTTIMGGTQQLWHDGQGIVAVLVLFAAVIAPAFQIGLFLLILLGARRQRPPVWVGKLLRHLPHARNWSMLEVMLLGVLVALTKIADYATVIPGVALFAVGGLVLLLPAMQSSFDPREVWERIWWAETEARQRAEKSQIAEVTA